MAPRDIAPRLGAVGRVAVPSRRPCRAAAQLSAPIYAHADGAVVSTIVPGDLGIPRLRHVHHAYPHYVTDAATGARTLYLLVHGWNEGKFAVLKHEPAP